MHYIGTYLKIPVYLHTTWFLFIFVYLFAFGALETVNILFAFFIILLHEFGHCIATKMYGYGVKSIVLTPMGGIASIDIPKKPIQEIVIALAGPLVNVLLIPVLYIFSESNTFLNGIYIINWMLLVFNLLPVFPLDGGRVFKGLLSLCLSRKKSVMIAGRLGQVFSVLFVILGIVSLNIMLILIGVMLIMMAEAEIQVERKSVDEIAESWALIVENQRQMNKFM